MARTEARVSPRRLIALLTQQRDLYRRLGDLSERQRTLIAGERPEMLLDILSARQRLVNELARINEQLGPTRREWEAYYADLPDDVRRRAGALLDEINDALTRILRSDAEDGALLAARRASAAESLGQFSESAAANSAYAAGDAADERGGSADYTA